MQWRSKESLYCLSNSAKCVLSRRVVDGTYYGRIPHRLLSQSHNGFQASAIALHQTVIGLTSRPSLFPRPNPLPPECTAVFFFGGGVDAHMVGWGHMEIPSWHLRQVNVCLSGNAMPSNALPGFAIALSGRALHLQLV